MNEKHKQELLKQAVDQPLHFLSAMLSVYMVQALLTRPLAFAVVFTAAWITYREWKQWPSSRWWDPPLDWAFFLAGILVAVAWL